jgi:hypothetical protein
MRSRVSSPATPRRRSESLRPVGPAWLVALGLSHERSSDGIGWLDSSDSAVKARAAADIAQGAERLADRKRADEACRRGRVQPGGRRASIESVADQEQRRLHERMDDAAG